MQKKQNTTFRVIDLVIIILCFTGVSVSGTFFWKGYNRTLYKLNEDPVGTIVFKRKTAERKFVDRVVWDRLKQTSPVYNNDTIRTIEESEAIITFEDSQSFLSLDESTLIQISYNSRQGASIGITQGKLDLDSGLKSLRVLSGSSGIVLDGRASLNRTGEGFSFAVHEGTAEFDGTEIEAGRMIAFDARGEPSALPMISMDSFGNSVLVLGLSGQKSSVDFSWKEYNFKADTRVIVEVAADRNFDRLIETRDLEGGVSSVSIALENGTCFWRAFTAEGEGSREPLGPVFPSGIMEIVPSRPAVALSPAPAENFVFSGESRITLSWTAVEGAFAYLLEISAAADMADPVVSRRVQENTVTQTGLDGGRWYWRVTPLFPHWAKGAVEASELSEFTVIRGNPLLAEPVLTFPANEGTLYIDSASRRLLWIYDPLASFWLVELADNPGMDNPAVKQNVTANHFSLPPALLQNGKVWYWRVSAQGGSNPAVSAVWSFTLGAGSAPSAWPVLAPPVIVTTVTNVADVTTVTSTPAAFPVPTPAPVQRPQVQTAPVPAPLPAPVPVTPQPAPETAPPAAPPVEAPATATPVEAPPGSVDRDSILQRLLQKSGAGTISESDNLPLNGHNFTTEQLRSRPSMNFVWKGRSSEYRFALYRTNGDTVVPPTVVSGSPYALPNAAAILTEGEYVWQIFEKDNRGNWTSLPSTASRFTVNQGQAEIGTMQVQDPGVLYGTR